MSAANDETSSGSTKTFVTALVTSLIIFGALMSGFFIFFKKQKRVFQPRSYLVAPRGRSQELPLSPIAWWRTVMATPLDTIIRTNGFDAYTFVRFILLLIKIFVPYFFLTWVLLMPLAAVRPTAGQEGLNQFTFGNVGKTVQSRYGGYIVALWLLTLWTLWCIYTETLHYIQARHSFLSSPQHANLVRSRTVLCSQLSGDLMNDQAIRNLCSPATVEKVFLVRNVKDVDDVYDEREKSCTKLETAEGKLIKLASKNIKKGKAAAPSNDKVNPEGGDLSLINSIVPIKKRPSHRLGKIPLVGKKVDTIEHSTQEIREQTEMLAKMREKLNEHELASTAIIRFGSQAEAITFVQNRSKDMRKKVPMVYGDVSPEAIYWPNLGIKRKAYYGRKVVAWTLTILLIIFWAPLVALAGAVANLQSLCSTVSFLSWVCRLPAVVVGIIQGVLPPLVVAVLFMLLPPVLTLFSKIQGIPLITHIELNTFKRYWLFAVINGFLVITFASGLAPALSQIFNEPGGTTRIPQTLATQLPSASIYFLTFVITSGLSIAGKQLSQTISVVVYKIKSLLGGSTPRKVFQLEYNLPSTNYLKVWPDVSLLAVLGIVYSCIQPIITLLCLFIFALYYVAFKYLYVYVYDQPDANETCGLFWPKAVNHLFVGLYIEHIVLAALFFLSQDIQQRQSAIPEGALAVVLLILTVLFHLYVTKKLRPSHIVLEKFSDVDHSAVDDTDAKAFVGRGSQKRAQMVRMHTMESGDRIGGNPNEHQGNTEAGDLEHGFDPPSTYQDQPTIWLAEDVHGLSRLEVMRIKQGQVDASMEGAHMDADSKIHVSRGPPDEYWPEGQNA